MLTKSKVLSNTGLDVSGSKVLVNNNINLNTNQTNQPVKSTQTKTREIEGKALCAAGEALAIVEPSTSTTSTTSTTNPYEHLDTVSYSEKYSELDLLKRIIRLYVSNILRIDGKLVLKNDDLIDLIKFITNAERVEIKVDYEVNCCGSSKGLNSINKILIINSSSTATDMKYRFNEEYNTLLSYGISLNFTRD